MPGKYSSEYARRVVYYETDACRPNEMSIVTLDAAVPFLTCFVFRARVLESSPKYGAVYTRTRFIEFSPYDRP